MTKKEEKKEGKEKETEERKRRGSRGPKRITSLINTERQTQKLPTNDWFRVGVFYLFLSVFEFVSIFPLRGSPTKAPERTDIQREEGGGLTMKGWLGKKEYQSLRL